MNDTDESKMYDLGPKLSHLRCSFFSNIDINLDIFYDIYKVVQNNYYNIHHVKFENNVSTIIGLTNYCSEMIYTSKDGRLDVIWNSNAIPFPILCQYNINCEKFFLNHLSADIFSKFKPINRLAIGGIILIRVNDEENCYFRLKEILSNVLSLDYNINKDFLYQTNISTSLVINGKDVKINRICNWRPVNLQYTYPSSQNPEDHYFISIQFDINTDFYSLLQLNSKDILIQINHLSNLIDDIANKRIICHE
jgi:hypothetical protein